MSTETSVSRSAVYRARPTLRLAGQADARVSELLVEMCVAETEGGMSTAELRFSNWASTIDGSAEAAFEDGSRLTLGTAISVHAGDETQPRELFRGVVSGLEAEFVQGGAPELVVLAEDALGRARMARRTRLFTDRSPADVVRAVAGELGLRPAVQGLDTPVATWAQLNESDLAFLRRLLDRGFRNAAGHPDEARPSNAGGLVGGSPPCHVGGAYRSPDHGADEAPPAGRTLPLR